MWLNVGFNFDCNPVQSKTLAVHSRETQYLLLAVKQYRYTDRNLCMVSLRHTFMATTTARTREKPLREIPNLIEIIVQIST